jgi:hypothetical protein
MRPVVDEIVEQELPISKRVRQLPARYRDEKEVNNKEIGAEKTKEEEVEKEEEEEVTHDEREESYDDDVSDGEREEADDDDVSEGEREHRAALRRHFSSWDRRHDKLEAYKKTEEQYVEPRYEYQYNVKVRRKPSGKGWVVEDREVEASEDFKKADRAAFYERRKEKRAAAGCEAQLTDGYTKTEYYEMFEAPTKQVYLQGSVGFTTYMQKEILAATYNLPEHQLKDKDQV